MTYSLVQLQTAWRETLNSIGVADEAGQSLFADVVAHYSSAGRFYHNLDHIAHLLHTIAALKSDARDYNALCLAIWFHDIVYNTQAADNEERSAAYAATQLRPLGVPEDIIVGIERLVLATKTHQAAPGDMDCAILLDADLSVLGAPAAEYDLYAQAIRQEYAWVPDDRYRAARLQVLRSFLNRPRLYLTDRMYANLEQPARHNLQWEINRLLPDMSLNKREQR